MPNYYAQVPPYSIFPDDVAFAFNNESPAAGRSSQQFRELILDPERMSRGLYYPIAVDLQEDSMSFSQKTIGYIVQLGGIGAFAAGPLASVSYMEIAAA